MACVRHVFPDAEIETKCKDNYPIKVVVEVLMGEEKKRVKIWKGKQQELFRKNAARREKAQGEIVKNLKELKETLEKEA